MSFDEAVDMFKASLTVLKKHIYSKRVQNREHNRIKEYLDHCEILVHVDYAESYKNVHRDEIQSGYFGNSIFRIFTACCYNKLLIDNGDGLKKDPVVVISESKDQNRMAALTCLKKVIEEVERINAANYTKVVVWSDYCAAQFRSRFVFRLLTNRFFEGIKLTWFYNEKSYGKDPDGVGGTMKNIVFRKVKFGFLTRDSPSEFYQAVKNYVPVIKCV